VVDQYNEISKEDGWKLLQDVTVKTPLQPNTTQEDCPKNSQVMDGLSQTYQKEAHGSSGKEYVASLRQGTTKVDTVYRLRTNRRAQACTTTWT
jgi:hypothetical protein